MPGFSRSAVLKSNAELKGAQMPAVRAVRLRVELGKHSQLRPEPLVA
jgi:hypothetical protein